MAMRWLVYAVPSPILADNQHNEVGPGCAAGDQQPVAPARSTHLLSLVAELRAPLLLLSAVSSPRVDSRSRPLLLPAPAPHPHTTQQ